MDVGGGSSDALSEEETLWRAEVLAPLRASMACMEGRLQEQEAALGRATREAELSAAKQRRADRLASEATERSEWLERKLDVAKHAAEAGAAQLERHKVAEAHAKEQRAELAIVKEQLLLIARSHREQEEQVTFERELVAAAAAREVELTERLEAAERGCAANERAAASAAVAEERHEGELGRLQKQLLAAEERATGAAVRHEAERVESAERTARADERADALHVRFEALRKQCDEQARAVEEVQAALRKKDATLAEAASVQEELRRKLSRSELEAAALKEAHGKALAEAKAAKVWRDRHTLPLMLLMALDCRSHPLHSSHGSRAHLARTVCRNPCQPLP